MWTCYRICKFFFVGGILSALLGTADHLFSLGIWHGGYPPVQTDANGHQTESTYGQFLLYAGMTMLLALIVGSWLRVRLTRRAERAFALLEAMRIQGIEEGEALNEKAPPTQEADEA